MNVPDWLTKEFLETVLENNQDLPGTKVKILNHEAVNDLAKGNNFGSIVLKLIIKYKTIHPNFPEAVKEISLITKIPLKNVAHASINKCGVIEKEFGAYNELLPKILAIIRSHEDNKYIFPKFFKTDVDNTIILGDLKTSGYKMADRTKQLDYEHGVITMQNIAKFHAASVVLHEKEPKLVETYGTDLLICKNMDDEVKKVLEPLIGKEKVKALCDEFSKWPETQKFVGFLSKLQDKVWDVYMDALYPYDGEFTVLNHGDLWSSNILYKYDEKGKPEKLKFLDFQMLRYTSPTMDLLNFMHISITYDDLEKHFNDLTEIYLENLNRNLKIYGSSKRLDEKDFKVSLERREIFALVQCLNILPVIMFEYDKDDDNGTTEFPNEKAITNKKFRTLIVKYLEKFSKRKWFQNFEQM